MKKLLLPIILLLLGTGAGVGAAIALKPAPEEHEEAHNAEACLPVEHIDGTEEIAAPAPPPAEDVEVEYVELENQFVIPIVSDEAIAAMVVMSLSIEMPLGTGDSVRTVEPKLRDGFLDAMFEHANIGGFSGNFTSSSNMRVLRADLLREARRTAGSDVRDVLILEIVRQDL